jgi:serine/threonine protein kinase
MIDSPYCPTCGAALPTRGTSCPWCSKALQNAPLHAAPPPVSGPGSLLAGRYRLLEKIGEGGFGLVYKARDERHGGYIVAIKQITLASLSAQEMIEATDSYNREITILSEVRYRGLPRVYDHFTDPEHWYVVMDYIKGKTLEETLAELPQGRLPMQQVLDIGLALCDVLGYLHRQYPAIIYRDVKPANIMMTPERSLFLIDFGIARRYRAGQSRDTGPLGSPGYAAPEQYGRAQTTPSTDIYGLGATLQTLLTGREPLEIRTSGIPADCHIPPKLQELIARMMERDPDRRPPNMGEVREALQAIQKEHSTQKGAFTATCVFLSFFLLTNIFTPSLLWIVGFLLSLAIIAGISIYHDRQQRRSTPGKLTLKEAYTLLKKSMIQASNYIMILFWCCYPLHLLHVGASALAWTILLEVGLVCLAWTAMHSSAFLKWLVRMRAAQRHRKRAQPAQTPPLQQQMRRHP